jgi:hypothetical protein
MKVVSAVSGSRVLPNSACSAGLMPVESFIAANFGMNLVGSFLWSSVQVKYPPAAIGSLSEGWEEMRFFFV